MHKVWLVALALAGALLLPADRAQAAAFGPGVYATVAALSSVERVVVRARRRVCGPRGCVTRRVCRRGW